MTDPAPDTAAPTESPNGNGAAGRAPLRGAANRRHRHDTSRAARRRPRPRAAASAARAAPGDRRASGGSRAGRRAR